MTIRPISYLPNVNTSKDDGPAIYCLSCIRHNWKNHSRLIEQISSCSCILIHVFVQWKEPKKTRHYVKIHLPLDRLLEEAEDLKLKAPLGKTEKLRSRIQKILGESLVTKLKGIDPLVIRDSTIEKEHKYFMAPFHKDKLNRYVRDVDELFTDSDWRFVTQKICFDAGLRTLLSEGMRWE